MAVSVRVLEDQQILQRCVDPLQYCFYTYTPGIWIATAVIVIVSIFLALFVSKKFKKDFNLSLAVIGTVIALPVFLFDLTLVKEIIGPSKVILFLAVSVAVITFLFNWKPIAEKIGAKLFSSNINKIVLTGQLLDGFATFTALQFPLCGEQHVVSSFFIETLGLWSFPLIKAVIAIVAIYLLDVAEAKDLPDKNLVGFLKMFIFIIGFAPGARDILTTALGTCGLS
ncbi:MAG: DUF63 family protein, partial [Candidatus Diapherotrites archaeon]|nr:DUF63 family protein [Candidatus Diapherotrites archaeon]